MSTYIKLEDVRKIFDNMYSDMNHSSEGKISTIFIPINNTGILKKGLVELSYLPSIDFEEMIKEMIEEYEGIDGIYHEVTDTLKELLAKIPK